MKVEKLDWDTTFFGYEIGEIEAKGNEKIGSFKAIRSFDLVYIYSKSPIKGIDCIDKKILFEKTIPSLPDESSNNVIVWKGGMNKELLDLAILSGHSSRFKKDERLNKKFNKLYTLWIEKSVSGDIADYVIVSIDNDAINGMLTLKMNEEYSVIGLVAVSKDAQGKGVGRKLMNKAFQLSKENNRDNIRVVTQEENIAAMNFYMNTGFLINKVEYIYHYWLKE